MTSFNKFMQPSGWKQKFYEQILLMLLQKNCMTLCLYALAVLCTLLLIKVHIFINDDIWCLIEYFLMHHMSSITYCP